MKLDIYDRIAELLTRGYKETKELPRPMTVWEWSLTEDKRSYDEYSFIIYVKERNAFFFAGLVGQPYHSKVICDKHSPIEVSKAVREVYPYLTEDEKTELMSTVLGAKDEAL